MKDFFSVSVHNKVSYCIPLCSDALSCNHLGLLLSHYHSSNITVLHVNVQVGFCIATVHDDRYGLGGERFEDNVHAYIFLLLFPGLLEVINSE